MATWEVKIEFNKIKKRWDMSVTDTGNGFIMDFPFCKNFRRFFKEARKNKPALFKLSNEFKKYL